MTNGQVMSLARVSGQRDDSRPGSTEPGVMRFHYTIHSGSQFKTYKLFISGIFFFNIFRLRLTSGN